ncbi:MAG: cation transporter [Marmoricola sp.]
MLTDVAGLRLALVAATLASRPATDERSWGYCRAEVLPVTAQAAVLLAVGVFVLVEGIRRPFEPPDVASTVMIILGLVWPLRQCAVDLDFVAIRGGNLNSRAAFLEVVNDALGALAVLGAAIVICHYRMVTSRRGGLTPHRSLDPAAHLKAPP